MKKSLNSMKKSKLDRRPTLDLMMDGVDTETWSYAATGLQFSFRMASCLLVTHHILCVSNDVTYLGYLLFGNGKKFVVPPEHREVFFAQVNKNAQNVHFFIDQDRNQLLLKCSLSFNSYVTAVEKINQCLDCIQDIAPAFEQALQSLGLFSKYNKFSYNMLKEQLRLKKNIMSALKNNSAEEQLAWGCEKQEQNSSVIRVKSVKETLSEIFGSDNHISKGGYFQVQKKMSIIEYSSGEIEEKQLAWKTPVKALANHKEYIESKAKKQIQLVQKIVDHKFLLNYYVNENQPSSIFMNYVPNVLKNQIYAGNLPLTKQLNLAQQLVEAVAVLHKSGLVHRDLKPENVLIEGDSLKIIDYAESVMIDQAFTSKGSLGYTLPYSPFQCSLGKEQGFNKKAIDLWSVSIILYEMTFKSIPLFYSRWVGSDILDKWITTSDFSISPLYRKGKGLRGIEQAMSLLSIRGIQVKQADRLSLKTYHKLLSHLQEYHQYFLKQF